MVSEGLVKSCGSVFLRFFDRECFLRHVGMGGYVSEGEEEDGHHERGYADEQAAVEQFASEHIEECGDNGGETDEQEEGVGRLEQVTTVVGIDAIESFRGSAQQSEPAHPDPDDLESKASACAEQHDITRDPAVACIEREEECDECRRKEEQRHLEVDFRAREGAQVRII